MFDKTSVTALFEKLYVIVDKADNTLRKRKEHEDKRGFKGKLILNIFAEIELEGQHGDDKSNGKCRDKYQAAEIRCALL